MPKGLEDDREGRIGWILTAPEAEVVSCREATVDEPPTARVFHSAVCAACGEPVMETRLREVDGQLVCIPCAERP
jgi:formylmethanofuran dehydrogenase subunit E